VKSKWLKQTEPIFLAILLKMGLQREKGGEVHAGEGGDKPERFGVLPRRKKKWGHSQNRRQIGY